MWYIRRSSAAIELFLQGKSPQLCSDMALPCSPLSFRSSRQCTQCLLKCPFWLLHLCPEPHLVPAQWSGSSNPAGLCRHQWELPLTLHLWQLSAQTCGCREVTGWLCPLAVSSGCCHSLSASSGLKPASVLSFGCLLSRRMVLSLEADIYSILAPQL